MFRPATAFANRDANFSVVAFGTDRTRLDEAWEDLYPHFSGLYLSFETDTRAERLGDAFPAPTLEWLRALKRRYDPDNVFRDNFNIAPWPAPPATGAGRPEQTCSEPDGRPRPDR